MRDLEPALPLLPAGAGALPDPDCAARVIEEEDVVAVEVALPDGAAVFDEIEFELPRRIAEAEKLGK